ncbi:MAG TPA: OmpA family protein [Polyangiaceae bacterium]|nr:OmpA family protein [Polyangiaceae bacterium]
MTALSGSVHAQDEGFALNRFEPAERGSDWFSQDSLNINGNGRFALGLTGDWAHKPLVMYDEDGDEVAAIVEDQLIVHLGGNVTLFDRLRLGVSVPLAVYQHGDSGVLAGQTFDASDDPSVGDVRLAGDVRIVGRYREPFSLAAGVRVWVPSGSQDAYTGDGEVRVAPRLLVAGDIGKLVYAANLGFYYRAQDQTYAGIQTGSEFVGGASLGARVLDDKLLLGPEIYFSTIVEDGDEVFKRKTTPFELLLGAHYFATSEIRLGAAFGPGLTRGIGAPEFRGLLAFDWIPDVKEPPPPPPETPKDSDGDGVLDIDDACVDVPGVASSDPKANGCPAPVDSDGDGVMDNEDACVTTPGERTEDPKTNGCPPPDRDGDGVLDRVDACPDEPGEKSDDPAKNGCPKPKDTDGDGIIDPEDACPEAAGPANTDPKKHGCPAARIEKGQIKIIERVEFKTASAELTKESEPILQAVYDVISQHPEFTMLAVEGHTDNKGNDAYNKGLSQRRAQSVVNWLVKKGIARGRLNPQGFGEERPIETNDTDEGRQNNRRVEFHIRQVDGKAVDAEGKPTTAAEPAPAPKAEPKPKAAPKAAPKAQPKPKAAPAPKEAPPKVDFAF